MNRISNFLKMLSVTKNLKLKTVFIAFCSLALFAALPAIAIDLPRTGQTTSYASGDDGAIQAGVAWPSPRFTDNGDQTITDNLTGLVWTKDAGTPTTGSCTGGTKTWQDALNYVACLNSNNYLSHNDWRLPNINELESLIPVGQDYIVFWFSTQGFSNLQVYYYWSSTTDADPTYAAWDVFMWGSGVISANKVNNDYVWPVRGTSSGPAQVWKTGQTTSYAAGDDGDLEKGAVWPNPRFTVSGDCVTDNLTGLMWTKNANLPNGTQTWQGALDYANSLSLCGYTDWRLPNRKELMSLIDASYNPALPAGHPFTNVQSSDYWSSTTDAVNSTNTWDVSMWMATCTSAIRSLTSMSGRYGAAY